MNEKAFKIAVNKEPADALKALSQINDEKVPGLMLDISKTAPLGVQIMALNLFAEIHKKIQSGELVFIPTALVGSAVKDIAKQVFLPENFTKFYDREKVCSGVAGSSMSDLREAFKAVDDALYDTEYVKLYDALGNAYRKYLMVGKSEDLITDTLPKIYNAAFPPEYNKFS